MLLRYRVLLILLLALCLLCVDIYGRQGKNKTKHKIKGKIRRRAKDMRLRFVYATFRSGEHYAGNYTYLPENYPITNNNNTNTLTSKAIESMYEIGAMIRDFYHKKICPIRRTTIRVTGGPDPKMLHSALLAYAGLMAKPKEDYMNTSFPLKELMKYYNNTIAYVFNRPHVNCKRFKMACNRKLERETERLKQKYGHDMMRRLREKYGDDADGPLQMWLMYEAYLLQRKYEPNMIQQNKDLQQFINILHEVGTTFPEFLFSTQTLKQLGAGQIMSHIIKDVARMRDRRYPRHRRFSIYAGGALDVAAQFVSFTGSRMDYVRPHPFCNRDKGMIKRPDYGAIHIVEVYEKIDPNQTYENHLYDYDDQEEESEEDDDFGDFGDANGTAYDKKHKQMFLRFLYKDDKLKKIFTKRHLLILHNCTEYCPLEQLNQTLFEKFFLWNGQYDTQCKNPILD